MGKSDFTEKLIIAGFLIGIFLPIRLVFVEYVSDQWLGNFGLISAIGLVLLILIKKGKLGKIGKIFEKQMKKTIFGKTGKFVIIFSMLSLVYFASSMMFIERGVTVYSEDQELFYDAIIQNTSGPIRRRGIVVGDRRLWPISHEYRCAQYGRSLDADCDGTPGLNCCHSYARA